jgi:hypothetical protein
MTSSTAGSGASSLEIRIAGAGISLRAVPLAELVRVLNATAALLRTVADELNIAAFDVALTALDARSLALRFEAAPGSEAAFPVLARAAYEAIRTRGALARVPVRVALSKLYDATRVGPIEVSARTGESVLDPVLMAQPVQVAAERVRATTVLQGRVEGVVCVGERFEIAFKPSDGSGSIALSTTSSSLAEQAAVFFNGTARVKARFARYTHGASEDWQLLRIMAWERRNVTDVLAQVGHDLHDQGFVVDAERFARVMREDRKENDE